MKYPNRDMAVRVRGEWYETYGHKEIDGRLFYILNNGDRGSAEPGDWKPLEEAKKQFEVKKTS